MEQLFHSMIILDHFDRPSTLFESTAFKFFSICIEKLHFLKHFHGKAFVLLLSYITGSIY